MTAIVALLSAILGLAAGVMWRECYELLKRLHLASKVLVARQQQTEQAEKKMTFADPATTNWDELDDQEKIDLING